MIQIREIDSKSESEILLVAQRMRQTLIDVLGKDNGTALYSMDWLLERVRWHLDLKNTNAKIYLSLSDQNHITGQAIARIEHDSPGVEYGYFSTLYVENESRRQGIATALMTQVENWFLEMKMPEIIYNTGDKNTKVIELFKKHGYKITLEKDEMVQLTKPL